MQKIKSFSFVILFGIAAFGLAPSPAGAAVVYSYTGSYTGNNFTDVVDPTPPAGTYTTSMSVSGSFTVAAPLLSLGTLTDISASLLSYSFTDGRITYDDGTSFIDVFAMSANALGDPVEWQVQIVRGFAPVMVGDQVFGVFSFLASGAEFDSAILDECVTNPDPTMLCVTSGALQED